MHLMQSSVLFSALLFSFSSCAQYIEPTIPDLCNSGSVGAAAFLELPNQSYRLFLASGRTFWLLNASYSDDSFTVNELPEVSNVQHLPFDFQPDVALFRDSRNCEVNGRKTLMLLEMKHSWNGQDAEWRSIEGWLDDDQQLNWSSTVEKIAFCDLKAKVCSTTNDYFATMGFDWMRKLDAAFGTIGETAFFIQDRNLFKVHYKTRCIKNPYKEVIAHAAQKLGTRMTAALTVSASRSGHHHNTSVLLFDHDMFYNFSVHSLDDFDFDVDEVSDGSRWRVTSQSLLSACPKIDSAFDFLAFDLFASSSKHFAQKPMVVFISCIAVGLIIVTVLCVAVSALLVRSGRRSPSVYQVNADQAEKDNLGENGSNEKSQSSERLERLMKQTSC